MRSIVRAVVDYENDFFAQALKDEITDASIKLHQGIKEENKFVFNFQTGQLEKIAIENNGDKLKWLIKEYLGYTKENYPEIWKEENNKEEIA